MAMLNNQMVHQSSKMAISQVPNPLVLSCPLESAEPIKKPSGFHSISQLANWMVIHQTNLMKYHIDIYIYIDR